ALSTYSAPSTSRRVFRPSAKRCLCSLLSMAPPEKGLTILYGSRRRFLRSLAFAILFAMLLPAAAQTAAQRPWRGVILNDGDSGLPAYVAMDRAMRAALAKQGGHPVDVFAESLDMLRFPEALYASEMAALLRKKYAGMAVDAVVAVGPASFE